MLLRLLGQRYKVYLEGTGVDRKESSRFSPFGVFGDENDGLVGSLSTDVDLFPVLDSKLSLAP
jgi:hypothetical protein